jgi:hypothetical protein
MSFIRPSAPSTVWKTFGATPRAWNGTRLNHARELTCSGGRLGCINQDGAGSLKAARRCAMPVSSTSYGDRFGEAVAEAEVAAAAAGDGALASPGFTLINSTSKMSVAFGPISPPVPPGP